MDQKVSPIISHHADLCVVGGGLAGMLTAIAAARRGVSVVLMQDRPMLGGNCSSEIRMWALGAHGNNNRETGILEEILLENMRRNPERSYAIWDTILYEKVVCEPNITLLLNCTCMQAETNDSRVLSVTGWQLTTYTFHNVAAKLFADCSGDSVLAPLTGAAFRMGRESRQEFGEDIAPEQADKKTMGLSCLLQARELDHKVEFVPPAFAYQYTEEDLAHRNHSLEDQNFWWIEIGGEDDAIAGAEAAREELLKIALGVWDHIKNRGNHGADNWELEFVGFLPGKRESRRYEGDHILTQNDVRAEGRFEDLIAYGGWSMDDHHPAGFYYRGEPTIYHQAPSPFGIPYRCLYSRSLENLFCAGRNISVTHAAMSSCRVMATCAILGQAAGTAAALCLENNILPRELYQRGVGRLQQALMEDDCYLPWHTREMPELTNNARISSSEGDPEVLRNGVDRPIGEKDNGLLLPFGGWVEYAWDEPSRVEEIRIVFDSDLNREQSVQGPQRPLDARRPMLCNRPIGYPPFPFPQTMTRAFRLEPYGEAGLLWAKEITDNCQRLVRIPCGETGTCLRLIPLEGYGCEASHIFGFDIR